MTMKTIVFAGPSATGKTYAADLLIKKYPEQFEQAKLYTTRPRRLSESANDRVFVTTKKFNDMKTSGDFLISDEFGGNLYGFDRSSLYPRNKHLLVNAWPWLINDLSRMKHVIIVGMQAPLDWENFLVRRMVERGDSENTIKKRKVLITKDVRELHENKTIVKNHGEYFYIENDSVITGEIIPWIEKRIMSEMHSE